jgi:hypothetical protein
VVAWCMAEGAAKVAPSNNWKNLLTNL